MRHLFPDGDRTDRSCPCPAWAVGPRPSATVFAQDASRNAPAEPIQEPITGREELGDLSKPTQALAQFYLAINTRDLDLMSQNWSQGDEAVMDNPVGGIKRGWPEIRKVYEHLFQGQAKFSFEFYDYTLYEAGDIFYVVGREQRQIRNR